MCQLPRSYASLLTSCAARIDQAQNAKSVREETAELASYLLSDKQSGKSPAFLQRQRSHSSYFARDGSASELDEDEHHTSMASDVIEEDEEPESPDTVIAHSHHQDEGPSILSSLLRRSPPEDRPEMARSSPARQSHESIRESRERYPSSKPEPRLPSRPRTDHEPNERSPLLRRESSYGSHPQNGFGHRVDLESQKPASTTSWGGLGQWAHRVETGVGETVKVVLNPQKWDRKAIWRNGVQAPVSCLPAVVVGLLLNILDALSYG